MPPTSASVVLRRRQARRLLVVRRGASGAGLALPPPARSRLDVDTVVRSGIQVGAGVASDPYNGHVFVNDGATYLEIENTSGGSRTAVLVVSPTFSPDLLLGDHEMTVPAGERWKFGPFKPFTFNQGLTGDAWLNVEAGLLLSAYRLANARYRR